MLAVATGAVAVSLVGYLFCRLTVDAGKAMPILLTLTLVAALAGQYWLRGERKLFNVLMMVLWIVLVTNGHFFPMYMAARTPVALNDALLANYDRMLGLEVPAIRAVLLDYPWLDRALLEIYKTLIPLMTLATIVPPLLGRLDQAKRYIVGCVIAAAISLPIFAGLQAIGPWKHYGFAPPFESLLSLTDMFQALKSSDLYVIDVTNRDGLITFPSFHVVLTVLAAVALWPFRWLRWPVVVWAALIVASTVTTGIHYSVDVLAGLAVASVAHCGALAYSRWERALSQTAESLSPESLAAS